MDLTALRAEFLARGFNDFEASGVNTRKDYYLNKAYHRINEREAWAYLETTSTGSSPLTISDLRAVLAVGDTTNNNPLGFSDIRDLLDLDPSLTATGSPYCWYQSSSTVIGAYPTTSVTLKVRYLKVPTDLSAGVDIPIFPARYHLAIVEGACAMAFRARNNLDMASACKDAYEEMVLEMGDSLNVVNFDGAREMVITDASTDW